MRLTHPILLAASVIVPLSFADAQSSTFSGTSALRPGDALRISVWRKPEYSGEFTISHDGSIVHPFYQQVRVAGVGMSDLRRVIGDHLAKFEAQPLFVVEPLLRVTVAGEVNRPGLLNLGPETSVAQAVAAAGGVSERGRANRVELFRDGRSLRVDLTRPGVESANLTVRSGDQIYVPRRNSVFREYVVPVVSIAGAAAAIINVSNRDR